MSSVAAPRIAAEIALWSFVTLALGAALLPRVLLRRDQSYTREAVAGLERLSRAARNVPAIEAVPRTPTRPCCAEPGAVCPGVAFAGDAWTALGVPVEGRHRYQYEIARDGERFVARAFGDLNCDGRYSTYEIVLTSTTTSSASVATVRATSPLE
jgi:hypothetical protein